MRLTVDPTELTRVADCGDNRQLLACFLAAVCLLLSAGSSLPAADTPDFENMVAPILASRCLECHNERDRAGGLALARESLALRGGDSGPVIVPGEPAESLLLARVVSGEMPPPRQGRSQRLPEQESDRLRDWIASGATWPSGRVLDLYERTSTVRGGRDWWSLQPIRRPEIPAIQNPSDEAANPVDHFIRARLEQNGWHPAPRADRRTLLRRLHADLIGLPPSAQAMGDFENDSSPTAYEQWVDRLLDMPQFGERWGRFWLDLARYAETCGYERDQEKPGAWRYRDWVIRALNEDRPYDNFIRHQLAGDEVPERDEETVIATGFLRLGTWNDEPNDPQEYKYERVEDLIHATSSAFLGMSVKCARCHDHKFDPIPQVDYYRLANAFWAGPIEPRGRELLGGPTRDELGFDLLGWTDLGPTAPPLRLLKKGDPLRPLDEVAPGQLSLVTALDRPLRPPADGAKTTGRRLQLAEWLTDPANPLVARVAVNRIWQHHFGQGLVRSPNNFGFTGDAPTHPELLDWLAAELIQGGWRMKRIHRLIVTSRTYQQASLHPRQATYEQVDHDNRLGWRANRRRLDAESLRDAMLVANDTLDLRLGGASFRPEIQPEALEGLSRKQAAWTASPASEQRRRAVYVYSQRSLLPPLLTTFDFCDTTQPCGQRDISIVPSQSLALLNNPFIHRQSEQLAARVVAAAGAGPRAQVEQAWRFALGRAPNPSELAAALAHLESQRQRFAAALERPATDAGRDAAAVPTPGLALHLRADQGVELDDQGRVLAWRDASAGRHDGQQPDATCRPLLVRDVWNAKPVVRFDRQRRFLTLDGQVLSSQQFTIVAVASDRASGHHREIISNWNRTGNVGTSVFLGLTGESTVRLSDDFADAGSITDRQRPFVLMATVSNSDATVRWNDQLLASKGGPLSPRRLDTPYVVGQQGDIDGEYWDGDLAELLVFDRALDDGERRDVWACLAARYLPPGSRPSADPALRAVASLCHVLLNSNEFLYVD